MTTVGRPRVHHKETRQLNADITDGPIMDSATGPWKFRVDHVYARWEREDSRRWRLEECTLTGPRRVAHGGEGVQRGEYALNEDRGFPDWLAPTLETNRPISLTEPCRHGNAGSMVPCRCNEFVACCETDLDEHIECMSRVDDGSTHGER
jgi:hypothetical protein